MMRKDRENQKGFTIIELLVVIIIIAILAMYAVTSLEKSYRRSAMQKNIEKLKSDLEFTRSEAFARARSVAVCPSDDISAAEPSCSVNWQALNEESAVAPGWIVYVNTDDDITRQTDNLILKKSDFDRINGKIEIEDTAFNAIRFTPRATTSNSKIVFNNMDGSSVVSHCDIVTFILGRVRKEGNGC